MDFIQNLSQGFSDVTNIDSVYTVLVIDTIFTIIIFSVIKKLGKILIKTQDNRAKEFTYNKSFQNFIFFIECLVIMCIWSDYFKSVLTFVTFLSSAIALALRDLILNWCCGFIIKWKKPFVIEDRIELCDIKGDVVNIKPLSFELLEVNGEDISGQSTGVIINFPNSKIFETHIKNFTKGFTYIWQEVVVPVSLTGDITTARHTLYRIINNMDSIKSVPKKMENQIKNLIFSYRVFFNHYEPVVYTKMVGTHVELTVRYLVHPKKARVVESQIWEKILYEFNQGNISLITSVQPVKVLSEQPTPDPVVEEPAESEIEEQTEEELPA